MKRCSILPLPNHEVQFLVDGEERLRWHYGPQYPRPFFYPLRGPASGRSLTRMGHPGAPDHDHHRGIWFAHAKLNGIDNWNGPGPGRVRQLQWYCYVDGDDEAVMAVKLAWSDGTKDLMHQDLIAVLRPGPQGETFVELQSTLSSIGDVVTLQKSNFGVLAVRVNKDISAAFGVGKLTNSAGEVGEKAVFGQAAAWMDYSEPAEGITFFDHASNPDHPTKWHVRNDGWMGASLCFDKDRDLAKPLMVRYLLHAHRGGVDKQRADAAHAAFNKRSAVALVAKPAKSTAWGVRLPDAR